MGAANRSDVPINTTDSGRASLSAGFIINAPTPDVLRIAPPLIITTAQVDSFVTALPTLLDGLEPTS